MKKIMIVEDSSLMIAVISNFIKKEGKEVTLISAHNGKEAIDMYEQEKPDIVFMDIKMPIMDGMQSLEEIKKKDPAAKVVMCTSLKEQAQEDKAKALGACGYIMKPFSRQDIISAIEKNTDW
ncbi:response regulator [Candidatus Woesearchaeota archaeon]|nr:response regulator [Candidatus Woesearchaeota archaeon]